MQPSRSIPPQGVIKKLRWKQSSGSTVRWIISSFNVIPSFWGYEIHNVGHSVSDIGLESSGIAYKPIQNDGAVSPGIHIVKRNLQYTLDLGEKLGQ